MPTLFYRLFILVYKLQPNKKLYCQFLRFLNIKTDLYLSDLRFNGVFKVKENGISFLINSYLSTSIENKIFWKGLHGWEPKSMKLWQHFSEKSNTIFDIGANTGIYSLIAESANSNALIWGFEPSERVYEKYVNNKQINKYRFNTSKVALSDINNEQIFYDTSDEHQYSASLVSDKLKNFKGYNGEIIETKVKCQTLDSFVKKENISKIDLIKIDTELHEAEVIEGYKENIFKHRPIVFIEILNEEIANKVQPYFIDKDYLYYNIDDEQNKIIKTDKIGKSNYFNYLLLPIEKLERLEEIEDLK